MPTFIYGFLLLAVLAFSPVRHLMESVLISHMLVQIPLLVVSGWLIVSECPGWLKRFFTKWNRYGLPGILLVVIITGYWLIPRTLDASLISWNVELFKFISLPFLAGIPLRDSWYKIGTVGQSFIAFNYISMFGLMSWLYIDAPVRICNNYLQREQEILGWGFLAVMISIILYIIQYAFSDHSGAVK